MRKLTEEEVKSRYLFIGECVDNNVTMPNTTKFGVNAPMTVQDICSSNVPTLQKIGVALEKVQKDTTESRFVKTNDPIVGKVPVSKWLDFIELTIVKKEHDAYTEKNAEKLKEIDSQLAKLETTEEVKARLQKEREALVGA
jgi:hypothetical protein